MKHQRILTTGAVLGGLAVALGAFGAHWLEGAVKQWGLEPIEQLKRLEKDGEISQDEHHKSGDRVQELTDSEIKEINDMLAAKESEIMTV